MQPQNRRSSTSITDAVYGRKRKPQQPAKPRRESDPRHTFDIAGQLDQETRNKLAALAGRASRKRRRGTRGGRK